MKKQTIGIILIVILSLAILAFLGIDFIQDRQGEAQKIQRVQQTALQVPQYETKIITVDGIELNAKIADTADKQTLGLSDRQSLGTTSAMLFIFATAERYAFWMKDMHFPLDMIWVDTDWKIVDITKDAEPSSYPQTFVPRSPAQYVIEVNAGFTDAHQIKIGDSVSVE